MTLSLGVSRSTDTDSTSLGHDTRPAEKTPRMLSQLFELSFDLMAVIGFDGYFKALNPAWSELLGFSSEELLRCPYIEFVHPNDRSGTASAMSELAAGSELIKFESRYLCHHGSYRWLSSTSIPCAADELIYVVARDVTFEHNRARLDRAQVAVAAVVAASGYWEGAISGVLAALCTEMDWLSGEYWRVDDGVLHATRTWGGAAGSGLSTGDSVPSAALRNKVPIVLASGTELASRQPRGPDLAPEYGAVGLPVPTPAGSRAALSFLTPTHYAPEEGLTDLLTAVGERLTELAERLDLEQRNPVGLNSESATLEYRATRDSLTSLANRELTDDRIRMAIHAARRTRTEIAVMVADLNRFKALNDTNGHEFGDDILRAVANRLEATVRESDPVGRIGGDEFAILVGGRINAARATALAAKICRAFQSPLPNCQGALVGLSVGVAMYPKHGEDPARLLSCADAAMHAAKAERVGRSLYEPAMRPG
ncbi:MAG: sensor domain-containing diguanylate cyclase [Candidatus Dormiibacterota bacterium]